MKPIKDKAVLIATALVVAGVSWAYFHYAGEWGMQLLFVIAFFVLLIDNHRLRKQLRKHNDSATAAKTNTAH